ncbi:hypothetical protein EJB05_29126, partial [Eragrostis curvula]
AVGITEECFLFYILFDLSRYFSNSFAKIRLLWRHYFQNVQGLIFVYFQNTQGLIFVVYSNELYRMLSEVNFFLE